MQNRNFDDKELFDNLKNLKDEIEDKLGFKLNWDRKSGKESPSLSKGTLTLEIMMNGAVQLHGI